MLKSKRLYINLLIFGLFFFALPVPWYVPFIIGSVFSWYVIFYEFLVLGLLMDCAFASGHFSTIAGRPFPLFFTLGAALIVVMLQTIKNKVRFYA